jgi:hypothetical protein
MLRRDSIQDLFKGYYFNYHQELLEKEKQDKKDASNLGASTASNTILSCKQNNSTINEGHTHNQNFLSILNNSNSNIEKIL